jgi:polyisoprenoid-binding protein YceI
MSLTESTTRSAATSELPSAGAYQVDPVHTHVGFAVKHFGLSRTRGEFTGVAGTVVIDEDATSSSVEVEIDATSIDTGDENRDAHVRSADFLDVETYPTLAFRSTGLEQQGEEWVLHGELTIRDTTRPVDLAVEFEGETVDPYGNARIAFTASTKVDRTDFGVSWSQTLDTGGLVVGKQVSITIDVEAIRPAGD